MVELGSIRQAAEKVHMSPSSVSRQIQNLEHVLSTELLVRKAQGVRLTPAGELVLRYTQTHAKEFQRLRASIDALRNLASGHVTVFSVEGMTGGLLPRAIAEFGRLHPGITFEIIVAGTDDVMRAVAEDRCDIGIAFQPYPRRDVEIVASFRQPLIAALSPAHELAGHDRLDLVQIEHYPVALPDRSFGIRHLIDHVLKEEQLSLNIRMQTNSIDMLRQFALHNVGVVFLPAFAFEREISSRRLLAVRVDSPALSRSTMQICKRADVGLTPAAKKLADAVTGTVEAFVA